MWMPHMPGQHYDVRLTALKELSMAITAYDHHATLRHEERDALGATLQAVLVDLTDLALAGNQLH